MSGFGEPSSRPAVASRGLSRRGFLAGSGALVVGFCLAGRRALAQRLPRSLARQPSVDSWLRIDGEGVVTLLTGKVELGQGIRTALAQIAADELDVELERLEVVSADTERSPNEGYTAGSMSIQQSGSAVRQAAAEARELLLELAGERLGVPIEDLEVTDGRVSSPRSPEAVTYWQIVGERTLHREADGSAIPKPPGEYRYVGRPVPRLDIPGKVFGEASYVHDLRLPGMLHARVVRPASYGARLESVDAAAARSMPGVVDVVRDGSFLAVLAEREEQAVAAAESLAGAARWSAGDPLPDADDLAAWLEGAPSRVSTVASRGEEPGSIQAEKRLEARYFKPYLAHASMAPSCAVGLEEGGQLTVWTHSQGVFPLRSALSRLLDLPEEKIRTIHRDGAGCYGHNGADDAACDAALLARAAPGRPVRVQWSREDELRWAPFGSAMLVRLEGGLDASGKVAAWRHELWSCPHATRPGLQASFVAAWHLADPQPPPMAFNIPQPSGGADRNAVPLYEFPSLRVAEHFVPEMPVRVSALRSLGAFGNVFAIESFIDELAAAAGADPVAFRLRHLKDVRGRAVIEAAAQRAGWKSDSSDGDGRGRGFAFARYKNQATWVALVVDVWVDRESGTVGVERAVAAVDSGQVVNPDGLRNQIEGGIVQATSWTLREQVRFDETGIASRDWRSYPILSFPDAPQVEVVVLDHPEEPSLGAGEAAQGPTAAAIANAVAAATGARVRELPLSPERVRSALASG